MAKKKLSSTMQRRFGEQTALLKKVRAGRRAIAATGGAGNRSKAARRLRADVARGATQLARLGVSEGRGLK